MNPMDLADCKRCPLNTRTPIVGVGNPDANIVIVGSHPSAAEQAQGHPFVGRTGLVVDTLLSDLGVTRPEVYTTHSVLCAPGRKPDGKDAAVPTAAIAACRPRLVAEITQAKPKVVLSLGKQPTQILFNTKENIKEMRASMQFSPELDSWMIATYDPTTLLSRKANTFDDIYAAMTKVVAMGTGLVPTPEVQPQVTARFISDPIRAAMVAQGWRKEAKTHTKENPFRLVCDIETNNTNFLIDELLNVAFCDGPNAYVVSAAAFLDPKFQTIFRQIYTDERIQWVFHNLQFDTAFLRHFTGLEAPPTNHDTMALAMGLTEIGNRVGLKFLSREWLNAGNYEHVIQKYLQDDKALATKEKRKYRVAYRAIPERVLAKYAAMDVYYTYRLMDILKPLCEREGTLSLVENVLVPAQVEFGDMHFQGVRVDQKHIRHLQKTWGPLLDQKRLKIQDFARSKGFRPGDHVKSLKGDLAEWINPSSATQMAAFLYDHMGYPLTEGTRTTGKEFLNANKHEPIAEMLEDYRLYERMKNTYVDGIAEDVWKDGRCHIEILLFGTVTGRQVIHNPELQTIPHHGKTKLINDEVIKPLRRIFLPDPGELWLYADFKQLEVRVGAHLSLDRAMWAALNEPVNADGSADFHRSVAAAIFKKEPHLITATERTYAKGVSFGVMYGMGASLLADTIGVSFEEAERYIDAFFSKFHRYYDWTREQHAKALREGFVETPMHRRRRFPFITSDNRGHVLNQAMNAPVQALASDMCLSAVTTLNRGLRTQKLGRSLFTVHDAIANSAKRKTIDQAVDFLTATMTTPPFAPSFVEFPVDVEIGENWGDCVGWDEWKKRRAA